MTNEATTSEAKVLEATETAVSRSTEILTQAFFRDFPRDAARKLESLMPEDAAHILASQPPMLRTTDTGCCGPRAVDRTGRWPLCQPDQSP